MMKKLLLLFLSLILNAGVAQSYISIASDGQGDDHYIDAKELSYRVNTSMDTLFIKLEHYNARSGDFGYALALDTNLNTQDGYLMVQNNLRNQTPNNSMNYDVALYAYQNGFFPGVYTEAYGSDGMATTLPFQFDTSDTHYVIFAIPLSSVGGNLNLNIVAYTGSFDISPVGSGPGDAMPDATYSQLRNATIGSEEWSTANFSYYPNPSSGDLHITNGQGILLLHDMKGRLLKTLDLDKTRKFDLSDLKAGTYLLSQKGAYGLKHRLILQ